MSDKGNGAPPPAASKKPLRQVQNVRELLTNENLTRALQQVAAQHLRPERMVRIVTNALRTTPQLQDADPMSLLGSVMMCATLGLEPNTVLGHAFLIPFKNNRKNIIEVQLIIGYKGFKELARRSGQVVSIHADVVYDDDELWSYEYGSRQHLYHKPGPRRGKPTHAYCFVKLTNGEGFVVLEWDQVMRTRDQSSGWRYAVKSNREKEHPWHAYEHQMAAKTAVRALANAGDMPMSIELLDALTVDESKAETSFRGSGVVIEGFAELPGGPDGEGEDVVDEGDAPPPEPPAQADKSSGTRQQPRQQAAQPRQQAAQPDKSSGRQQPAQPAEPAAQEQQEAAQEAARSTTAQGTPHDPETGEVVEDGAGGEVADDGSVPDELMSLVERIVADLDEATEQGEIEATLELFEDQIDHLNELSPRAGQLIDEAADRNRERVAAASGGGNG